MEVGMEREIAKEVEDELIWGRDVVSRRGILVGPKEPNIVFMFLLRIKVQPNKGERHIIFEELHRRDRE